MEWRGGREGGGVVRAVAGEVDAGGEGGEGSEEEEVEEEEGGSKGSCMAGSVSCG